MAFQNLKMAREPISFDDFGRDVARRRAEYEAKFGAINMPRNSGLRRTESKKSLLREIQAVGGNW
jgi:hypothetical protein